MYNKYLFNPQPLMGGLKLRFTFLKNKINVSLKKIFYDNFDVFILKIKNKKI